MRTYYFIFNKMRKNYSFIGFLLIFQFQFMLYYNIKLNIIIFICMNMYILFLANIAFYNYYE